MNHAIIVVFLVLGFLGYQFGDWLVHPHELSPWHNLGGRLTTNLAR